jgi:hypothetical protein
MSADPRIATASAAARACVQRDCRAQICDDAEILASIAWSIQLAAFRDADTALRLHVQELADRARKLIANFKKPDALNAEQAKESP